uniref:Putative methyltransferase n=1 Tax=viral metagenome TaxID=1070528 RepID=A0A6M3LB47_9ZZZZ
MIGTYPVLEITERDLKQRNLRWRKFEGEIEKPTQLETYQKPEQQRRLRWLVNHCKGTGDILEIGCSWGYVLNAVGGRCGVDISGKAIDVAMRTYPLKNWLVSDVTRGLPFENGQYKVVLLTEILEHLKWENVKPAVFEALRITSGKVLITLPLRPTADCALCFKHRWLVDWKKISHVWSWVLPLGYGVTTEADPDFIYMEIVKC